MLSDLCHDEFDFAWQRPVARFPDSEQVRDILQQTSSVIAAINVRSYSQDTLSAAVGSVIQTGGYSYGQCMKVLRKAVCGPEVCTTYRQHIQGGPKKVSLVIFAITLSTASQFS